MKISVLVPVYNVNRYLSKCLDSILSQDYDDFEVILVDDGSKDGSELICDDYHNRFPERIKVIHKENQGLISARRIGIREASGDYCVFVDSDDYVANDLLSSVSEFICEFNLDIVLYSFTYFDENGIGKRRKSLSENGRIWTGSDKKELYTLLSTTSNIDALFIKAVKTSILKEDATDYTVFYKKNMSEDTLQSIYPMTAANSIGYLDKSLYFYRYNPLSISRNFSVETIEKKNTVHVYNEIIKYLPIWDMDSIDFKKRVDARWFDETMYLLVKSYAVAASRKDRKAILDFDWDSMIPCLEVDSYKDYVNPIYYKIYDWYKHNKNCAIRCFSVKNKLYKKYKSIMKKNEH